MADTEMQRSNAASAVPRFYCYGRSVYKHFSPLFFARALTFNYLI